MPNKFGVRDHPPCSTCGGETFLVRREAHPTRGAGYELQAFMCGEFQHRQERDADVNGAG